MAQYDLIATAAFGLEAEVKHELKTLGYRATMASPGRVLFQGDEQAIREANLHLRCAERILVRIASGPADDFDKLFELVQGAPLGEWIPPDGRFPVRARSYKSQLTSLPAIQRTVKKAAVETLRTAHSVDELPETNGEYAIEIALAADEATLLLDTTGVGLHKRGYRPLVGRAPLRETLAAALVRFARWKPEQPLWDPFCGTGTLAIEAAMIGRRIAPGLRRAFACELWPRLAGPEWAALRESAERRVLPELPERIHATDSDEEALKLARRAAEAAGVADDIHFQRRAFEEVRSKREYGCLITNPPYGERIGEREEIERLYQSMPEVLRRLKTWSHYVLTARLDFEQLVGQTASKRRKLFNGRLECTLFQYHGPKKSAVGSGRSAVALQDPAAEQTSLPTADRPLPTAQPAFGGLLPESERQAREFGNALAKRAKHLRKWPTKRGITCYRLYDRDMPEAPFAIDRYGEAVVVAEYERPHERTPAQHADWLDLMVRTIAKTLDAPREEVYLRRRERQRGEAQYERQGEKAVTRVVEEAGLRFGVNLTDYLDTGLFLDHRVTRGMVREGAEGKRFLNLFAYTGSFSVYAAAGGAASTTTVDLSQNYLDRAAENLRLNGFEVGSGQSAVGSLARAASATADRLLPTAHSLVRADSREFVDGLPRESLFDLVVCDPPTFSNSKRLDDDWDVQRDAVPLLVALAPRVAEGGVVYYSTNFRRFKLNEEALAPHYAVREISRQTVPEDFRNKRIHRCWRLVRAGGSTT